MITMTLALMTLSLAPVSEAESLDVRLRDSNDFAPDRIAAQPGESLTLHLINDGFAPHSFTLFSDRNPSVPLSDEADLQAYNATHIKLVDVWLKGGEGATVTFTAPSENGTYVFVCMVPLHTVGGMHGQLIVGEEPSGIEPMTVGVIVAISVAVAAISILVLLKRRRP